MTNCTRFALLFALLSSFTATSLTALADDKKPPKAPTAQKGHNDKRGSAVAGALKHDADRGGPCSSAGGAFAGALGNVLGGAAGQLLGNLPCAK